VIDVFWLHPGVTLLLRLGVRLTFSMPMLLGLQYAYYTNSETK